MCQAPLVLGLQPPYGARGTQKYCGLLPLQLHTEVRGLHPNECFRKGREKPPGGSAALQTVSLPPEGPQNPRAPFLAVLPSWRGRDRL